LHSAHQTCFIGRKLRLCEGKFDRVGPQQYVTRRRECPVMVQDGLAADATSASETTTLSAGKQFSASRAHVHPDATGSMRPRKRVFVWGSVIAVAVLVVSTT
jgi:hypothetical protein